MARIGQYRHRIVIQKRVDGRDTTYGGVKPAYSQFAVRWARKRPLSGSERLTANQTEAEVDTEWAFHHTEGVQPKYRILAPMAHAKLASAVTGTGVTSLTVDDAGGFPIEGSFRVRLASEVARVTAGPGATGGTAWTVERGMDGTSAAAHASGTTVQHMAVHDIEAAWDADGRLRETVVMTKTSDAES